MTSLFWFRRDLRLADNPALHRALEEPESVYPVYIHSPDEEAPWQPGGASRWYLHQSLKSLSNALAKQGGALSLAEGDSAQALLKLADEVGAKKVYWNRVYEPAIVERDKAVKQALQDAGFEVKIFHDQALLQPGKVLNQSGSPYKVFSPFWRQLSGFLMSLPSPIGSPDMDALSSKKTDSSVNLDDLSLLDTHPWHEKLHAHWQAGENAAETLLEEMAEKVEDYPKGRDFLAQRATSRLSAALHFGEISPRRVLEVMMPIWQGEPGMMAKAAESYVRQLGWREFAINLLFENPSSAEHSLQQYFDGSDIWYEDQNLIEKWQRGETGYILVDAAMRELWETGWMHNRARMVVASFLTKNLGQHWIHGARWFWDTLVDADLANNTMGWQWVAGCGCDASPYYRVFNPIRQAERFDPKNTYQEKWLSLRDRCGEPIVDLAESREAALARYKEAMLSRQC